MTHFSRSSGVLLHITSLPGRFGVGDLGNGAREFVDFLVEAGQRIWQLLPVGPTIQCESPYSCYSAFAGNPLLISGEELVRDGFLDQRVLDGLPSAQNATCQADYRHAHRCNTQVLQAAYQQFRNQSACHLVDEFESFCVQQRYWLDPFALFAALMEEFNTDNWITWPDEIRARQPDAVGQWRDRLSRAVEYQQFVQYLFFMQWEKLKRYAANKGVKLFGDMPIFVAHGSADVWAHQSQFHLESSGQPSVVAGVPPDYFSKTGQLWGNPLYNWEAMAQNHYQWWTQRFQIAFELYDLLRIDHFRGFEAYWEVPASAKTAVDGQWVKGPGTAPFDAAQAKFGDLPIVAEDLGLITDKVHALRDTLGFPGMRVAQFGFDNENDLFHRPESFPTNSVAYTGTHDNSTIVGWLNERNSRSDDVLDRYLEDPVQSGMPYHWQLISMVMRSNSHTAIVPMQDILGLDDRSRMNIPGQATGNWGWRLDRRLLTDELIERVKLLTVASERTETDNSPLAEAALGTAHL